MKVQSFMRHGYELQPVEVELSLSPGLPQFHFTGLPDTALRESALRIRSAIREQGFDLPQAQSILVHLRPTHLKKSSRGLDLAIAAALLWEMGQVKLPERSAVLYGELTLKGEIRTPDDIEEIEDDFTEQDFFTGAHGPARFARYQLKTLRDLIEPPPRIESHIPEQSVWRRPAPGVSAFSKRSAELGMVIAAGEHPALLAGPPGTGKSTLAEAIPAWIDEPDLEITQVMLKISRRSRRGELSWRPVLHPHHSITPLAMIGGGQALWQGEITRAHGGVLIMDELLEFDQEIQESLREPLETGEISIVRAGNSRTFPASILLLATTNLCPCGKFVPRRRSIKCRCRSHVRRRVLSRLSGPFTDRFQIASLTDEWNEKEEKVSVKDIFSMVEKATHFRKNKRRQKLVNAVCDPRAIEESLSEFQRTQILEIGDVSRRRKSSVLRVARTLADLREDVVIDNVDLDRAIEYAVQTHQMINDWSE